MRVMRAKMELRKVEKLMHDMEILHFQAVSRSDGYPADGTDEDNTYAKFTPAGSVTLSVANTALHNKFTPGQKFYLDFTIADK